MRFGMLDGRRPTDAARPFISELTSESHPA